MHPDLSAHLLSCLCSAEALLSELVGSHDPRITVFRQELAKAKSLLEQMPDEIPLLPSVSHVNGSGRAIPVRPTLEQALACAVAVGVSEAEADAWWHAREASDWLKGTVGGGIMPIGSNYQADLKTYTNALNSRQNGPSNGSPREGLWHWKTSLEQVETELGRLETKTLYNPLSIPERDLRERLRERRRELRQKISGVDTGG